MTARLTVVGTPIGNLGDLPPRAVETLAEADIICCEDTRRTRVLLSAKGIPAGRRLTAVHAHNEAARTKTVLDHLAAGRHVALVTDAGMPAVSDPGSRLIEAAANAGYPVTTVPGPSSVLAALVVSGLPTDRFCVEGFLPRRGAERTKRLAALAGEERTAVVLESPQRLTATLKELSDACGPERRVAVARELTKLHEEVWRGTLDGAVAHFGADEDVRGEVTVVLGGAAPPPPADEDTLRDALRAHLRRGATPRAAADAVAEELDVPRRRAYQHAIELRDAP